jgi:hypothetical protein
MTKVAPEFRHEPLDCAVRIVTPERIVLWYPLAGPFRRFVAYFLDQLLLIGLGLAAFFLCWALSFFSAAGVGAFLIAYFVLTWG